MYPDDYKFSVVPGYPKWDLPVWAISSIPSYLVVDERPLRDLPWKKWRGRRPNAGATKYEKHFTACEREFVMWRPSSMTRAELASKLADVDPLMGIAAGNWDAVAREAFDNNFTDGTIQSVILFLSNEPRDARLEVCGNFVQRLADGRSRADAVDAALFPEGSLRTRWETFLAVKVHGPKPPEREMSDCFGRTPVLDAPGAVPGAKKPRHLLSPLVASGADSEARGRIVVVEQRGSIQDALDSVRPGDVVSVHGGCFFGAIETKCAGTEAKPITIRPFGDGEVTISALRIRHTGWEVEGISALAKDVAGKELGFQGPFGDDGVASVASSGGVLLVEALPGVKLTNVRVVVRGSGESQIDLTGGDDSLDASFERFSSGEQSLSLVASTGPLEFSETSDPGDFMVPLKPGEEQVFGDTGRMLNDNMMCILLGQLLRVTTMEERDPCATLPGVYDAMQNSDVTCLGTDFSSSGEGACWKVYAERQSDREDRVDKMVPRFLVVMVHAEGGQTKHYKLGRARATNSQRPIGLPRHRSHSSLPWSFFRPRSASLSSRDGSGGVGGGDGSGSGGGGGGGDNGARFTFEKKTAVGTEGYGTTTLAVSPGAAAAAAAPAAVSPSTTPGSHLHRDASTRSVGSAATADSKDGMRDTGGGGSHGRPSTFFQSTPGHTRYGEQGGGGSGTGTGFEDDGQQRAGGTIFDLPLVKNGLPRGRIRGRCTLVLGSSSGSSLLRLGSVGALSVGGVASVGGVGVAGVCPRGDRRGNSEGGDGAVGALPSAGGGGGGCGGGGGGRVNKKILARFFPGGGGRRGRSRSASNGSRSRSVSNGSGSPVKKRGVVDRAATFPPPAAADGSGGDGGAGANGRPRLSTKSRSDGARSYSRRRLGGGGESRHDFNPTGCVSM